VDCSSLGPRELHGLTEPVALFRAIGPAPADRARRPTAESMRTPFVGRDDALEAVLACYHRAEQGHGQAVFVTAEAGLGKSRLVQEVQLRTEAAARWLTCWCSPYEQNTSLFSVIELVERLFELAPGTDPVARLRALERRVERFGLDAPDAVPLLGTLLSLPVGPSEAAMLGPGARSRTLNTLVELVRHLSRETPVVFAVEDLHWADPSTLDFVTLLVTRIAEERVLLLLTGRPEVEPTWPAGPNQTSIQLQPLSERHAEQLLVQWSTGRELPLGIVREVIERTEGVPLFLEELTKAVVDTGMAALKSPGPMPEPDVSKVIPNSLRDSLTARLDRLGDAKETAQLAAVIGSGLRPQMLHAVGSLGYETMQDHLAQLVTSGLLYRVGESPHERFYFKHALIQETAYGTLLKSRQRQIHDHIVRVVHESFPTILDDEPEKLAWHCEEAGRIEDAIDAFERAAARATTRWAYVEASRSLQKALVLLDRVEASERRDERELRLLEALQAPVFATRGYTAPELPGIYDRIRALAKEKGTPIGEFALLARSWGFHCVHGDRQETLDLADEILESWSTSELPTRALAGWMLGATYFYSGQHARALQFLNPCVEFFHRGVTDPAVATPLFLASLTRGWALALAGYPVQALATLEAAVAAAESFGDPFAITQALTHLMIAEYDLGCEPDPIQRHAARALELSAARHLPQTLNSARAHLGWAAAAKGDERGIEEARQAVAGMRAIGTLNPVGTLIILLADAQWRLGRHDAALEAIEECLQECATNLARHHEPHAYLLKGTLLWQKRDRRGAEQCLRTALEVARAQDAKIFELRAATALARLAAEDGRATDGNAELAAVYHWFREGSDSRYLREAKALLDQLSPAQAGRVPLA
jgi:tetratricopeptide (TPR) repeat protein